MPGSRAVRRGASADTTVVVRVPADGWPGDGLAGALGDGFLVIASQHLVPEVVVWADDTATAVRRPRHRQPQAGIVAHTTDNAVVDVLRTCADVAIADAPLLEVAARIRPVARRLRMPRAPG